LSAARKGLLLAGIQIALLLSVGGKLQYDRATRPRGWARAQVYDPNLPIRGRYLSETLEMPAEGFTLRQPPSSLPPGSAWYLNRQWVYLQERSGQVMATSESVGPGAWAHLQMRDGQMVAQLEEPVLIFISDQASVPLLRQGDEMWVEVTLPAKGPPRPLRVGIKKNGVLQPLSLG
jgi:hypothetical protein